MSPPRPAAIDMVVDTSALMSITLGESSADAVLHALSEASGPVISAGTMLELSIVIAARLGARGPDAARTLLDRADVVTMPVDDAQVAAATAAWLTYGKGRHRAALNFGDCFAYALARHCEVPLLCVGDDFRHTDVPIVDLTPPG